jgi:hypothetical protein
VCTKGAAPNIHSDILVDRGYLKGIIERFPCCTGHTSRHELFHRQSTQKRGTFTRNVWCKNTRCEQCPTTSFFSHWDSIVEASVAHVQCATNRSSAPTTIVSCGVTVGLFGAGYKYSLWLAMVTPLDSWTPNVCARPGGFGPGPSGSWPGA